MFKEELIIIRHARSNYNVRKTDDLDTGLTEFGKRQAKNVSEFFKHSMNVVDHTFFTSPFLRCLQTANEIAPLIEQCPIIMPELREYLNHSGKSARIVNRQKEYPQMNWTDFHPMYEEYDEEFNETFLHRMHVAYDQLDDRSIVVTHGLPALLLLHIGSEVTRSVPVWDHSIDNCSITVIRKGRLIWRGRNLFHEHEYDPGYYSGDLQHVMKRHSVEANNV